jgi:predicted transcriptional regulator
MKRDHLAEFRDPETHSQIMLRLFLAGRPLSFTEIAEQLDKTISAVTVAGNCGELRANGWIAPARSEGTARMELTVPGTDAVRKMFPSA